MALRAGEGEVLGRLRVGASVGFGRQVLFALVRDFMAKHPALQVDLQLNDGFVDVVSEDLMWPSALASWWTAACWPSGWAPRSALWWPAELWPLNWPPNSACPPNQPIWSSTTASCTPGLRPATIGCLMPRRITRRSRWRFRANGQQQQRGGARGGLGQSWPGLFSDVVVWSGTAQWRSGAPPASLLASSAANPRGLFTFRRHSAKVAIFIQHIRQGLMNLP